MGFISDLCQKLAPAERRKVIRIKNQPYLVRYYLGQFFGYQIWLHHFLTSDGERHFHDHPWSAVSFVLSGGYWEQIQLANDSDPWVSGIETRYRDWFFKPVRISRQHRHRIVSVSPDTWTLMLVSPTRQDHWHFYHPMTGEVLEQVKASPADWWKDLPSVVD